MPVNNEESVRFKGMDLFIKEMTRIKEIYRQLGKKKKKEFREMLSYLGSDPDMIRWAGELVRHFDRELKRFRPRYQRMKVIIGNDIDRWNKFLMAIDNFEPGKKGKGGGLKAFSTEFRQEWNEIVRLIKEYKALRLKKDKQSKKDKKRLEKLEREIPKKVRTRWRKGTKGLAIDWMERDYPFTKSALRSFIRNKSQT